MQRKTHPSAITVPPVALVGAAFIGGCALIYNFDYKNESSTSGTGGGSSSGGTLNSSSSSSNSNSSSSSGPGGGGASASSSTAGGGGSGGGFFPGVVWKKQFGGAGNDTVGHPGLDINLLMANDGLFITGVFDKSINLGLGAMTCTDRCSFVAGVHPMSGAVLWNSVIADAPDTVPSLAATPDHGVVVAGSFTSKLAIPTMMPPIDAIGLHDIFVAKFSSAGVCQWRVAFGDANEQYANAVAADDSGLIYVTGRFSGTVNFDSFPVTAPGMTDTFLVQLTDIGKVNWARELNTPSTGLSLAPIQVGIALGGTFTGMISLGGMVASNPTNTPVPFLATLNPNNMGLYVTSFSGKDISLARDALLPGAVFGITEYGVPGSDMGIGTLNKDGDGVLSMLPLPGTANGVLESIVATPQGRLAITGYSKGALTLGNPIPFKGQTDVFLSYLKQTGMVSHGEGYGDASAQAGRNVIKDAGGNLYLFGDFLGSIDFGDGKGPFTAMMGGSDMFLVKLSNVDFL